MSEMKGCVHPVAANAVCPMAPWRLPGVCPTLYQTGEQHIDQMPPQNERRKSMLILTGKITFWKQRKPSGGIQLIGKHLVLSILCCWFVIEGQRDQPIEGQCGIDLRPIWNICNSLPNIGHHPLSLCVYSVRSPALPSAHRECKAGG